MESAFFASMISSSDRRQIRQRYATPHELGSGARFDGDQLDPLAQMLACQDPRQVRFRDSTAHHPGAAVA